MLTIFCVCFIIGASRGACFECRETLQGLISENRDKITAPFFQQIEEQRNALREKGKRINVLKARIIHLKKDMEEHRHKIKCTKDKIAVIENENLVLKNASMSYKN